MIRNHTLLSFSVLKLLRWSLSQVVRPDVPFFSVGHPLACQRQNSFQNFKNAAMKASWLEGDQQTGWPSRSSQ